MRQPNLPIDCSLYETTAFQFHKGSSFHTNNIYTPFPTLTYPNADLNAPL